MNFAESFKTAGKSLSANKARSALTMLGIVIGIAAIIMVMSLGQGAQNLILSQIQFIGSKTIAIVPGRQPKGFTDAISVFTDSLKEKDLQLLLDKGNVPHLAKAMPVLFGSKKIVYESENYQTTIFGATGYFAEIYGIYPDKGVNISDEDAKSYADVIVIGAKVKDELFGNDDAVGKQLKIDGKRLRVVGVLPKKGQVSFIDFDEAAIIPYTTAQRYIFGVKHFDRIVAEADSEQNVAQTVEDIKLTLRISHNITDPDKDDFFVQTQAQAMDIVGTVFSVITLLLATIAAISLLVGGVGIMNIMLVSVTERTREIGLRKAVGATRKDIMEQFLTEAVILTVLGGIGGIVFGLLVSVGITAIIQLAGYSGWQFVMPLQSLIIALVVVTAVGLVFGIYPARKASKLNPIEALRYE